jgi:zeta-carotene desaturase
LSIGTELLASSKQKEEELATLTVDQWLSSLKQTTENRKYLWDILAVGTLNDDPSTVSALLFYRVLKAAFLGNRLNSSLLIPKVGLSELLVDPAARYIESHGGEILTGTAVESIETRHNLVEELRVGRKKLRAHSYISSIPYHSLSALKLHGGRVAAPAIEHLEKFESSPIITLHLWLDQTVIEHEFVATLDSTIQWIFNKTRMYGGDQRVGKQYLSLLISGAGKYVGWSKEKLVVMAMKELRNLLPAAGKARLLHSVVIKEKRATFSAKPGIENIRPGTTTTFPNFFLAGDWTATGYPATIEGAVMSGFKAAEAVGRYLGGKRLTG